MCLGIPGKIVDKYMSDGLEMGKIDFGGTVREACLSYVPETNIGDYVIVHVGFAISVLSQEEAQASLEMLNQMMNLEKELGPEPAYPE